MEENTFLSDENEFVDYIEEEEIEYDSTDAGFNPSTQNAINNSDYNASQNYNSVALDPDNVAILLDDYIPSTDPKLDFGRARYNIDEALRDHIQNVMFHDKRIQVDFSTSGFSILNKTFRMLHTEEQTYAIGVLRQLSKFGYYTIIVLRQLSKFGNYAIVVLRQLSKFGYLI